MRNAIDYIPGTSPLHRLNPVTKLAIAASIITATFFAQSWAALTGLLALTLALGMSAGALPRLADMLKVLAPIALVMFLLQIAFTRSGDPILFLATSEGLQTGSRACLRLVGVALPLVLMLAVTRLTDLADACVEVLHIPYRYAFTFTTALRFVPVFTREMNAIMEAQTARGVEFDTRNPFKKMSLMLPVCIPLLVTSVAKTDAAALAAEQRGFYLRTRESSYKRYPMLGADAATLACCAGIIALGILL